MAIPAALYQAAEVLPNRREFAESQLLMQPNVVLTQGTLIGEVSTTSVSEVQTLTVTGTPTGGTFRLNFNGQTTAAIAYNATAAQVAAAVAALTNVGAGNVAGTGGPLPGTPVVLTFQGDLANLPVPNITVVNPAFTGGSTPAAAVVETTPGVAKGRNDAYASGNSNGTQIPKGILRYSVATDERGRVYLGTRVAGTPLSGGAPVYLSGFFRTGDLIGLDTNAVSVLQGRFTRGDISTADGEVAIPGP